MVNMKQTEVTGTKVSVHCDIGIGGGLLCGGELVFTGNVITDNGIIAYEHKCDICQTIRNLSDGFYPKYHFN